METLRLDEERRLATTIALHDALSVRDAIKASASIYLDLRAADPSLEPTTHMPGLLYDLIERAVLWADNKVLN
nr:putative plasmid-related protein [uncultured bacterium]